MRCQRNHRVLVSLLTLALILGLLAPVGVSAEEDRTAAGTTPEEAPRKRKPAPTRAELGLEDAKRTAQNTIYVEGMGPGLLYSINYDRLMIDELAARVGFAYFNFSASVLDDSFSVDYFMFPFMASYVGLYSGSHALEVGLGGTLVYVNGEATSMGMHTEGAGVTAYGNAIVGYRLQPMDGGFNFRIGLQAIFGRGMALSEEDPTAFGALPWAYLSLGYTF